MTLIKPGVCADLDTADTIFDTARADYPHFDRWLTRPATQARTTFTATTRGGLTGLVVVKDETAHPVTGVPGATLKLCTVTVAPHARGNGVGTTLISAAVAHAATRGHRWVYVTTFDRHQDLVRLAARHGFTVAARTGTGELVLVLDRGPRPLGRVALMSIHGRYIDAILDGTKRVELRKRPLAPDVTHVVMYATRPTGLVVGAFDVTGHDTGTPDQIWDHHAHHGGIDADAYDAYFTDPTARAVAIGVGATARFTDPVTLRTLTGTSRAPQSFAYLTPTQVAVARHAGLDRLLP